MQAADVPIDLPAPTAELLTLLSAILAQDATELPPSILASSMLVRHRFLNLTPEDPRYFQSRDSAEVSQALEVLRNLGSSEWQLSPWQWRAAPSEMGGIQLCAKVIVTPSDSSIPTDGLALVLSYEPASTPLTPVAGVNPDEGFKWKYLDMVAPVSFETWQEDLPKAIEELPLRYRQPHSGATGGEDDGQIDAPEMSAEDFWEGANSDSSGSLIDELEASTQKLRLDSSLPLPHSVRDSPTSAHFKHSSAPPSPITTTAYSPPPSIVLSPPAPFPDLHSSQPRSSHSPLRNVSNLQSLPPAAAEAVSQAHVLPEELSSLQSTLKGVLDLWARAGSSSLDMQLSRLHVFEEAARTVVSDYEQSVVHSV